MKKRSFAGLILLMALLLLFGWFARKKKQNTEDFQINRGHMNLFQLSLAHDTIVLKNEKLLDSLSNYGNGLKIANWNIERGYKLNEIIEYLKSTNSDIICLQEIDWNNKRTNFEDIGKVLAEQLNMVGFFGIEFYELDSPLRTDELSGGGVHGNMILTRIKPLRVYRVNLPVLYNWHSPPPNAPKRSYKEPREGKRFSLCGEFLIHSKIVTICSVHSENFEGGARGRIETLDSLLNGIKNRGNLIIAGDFNTFDSKLSRFFGFSDKEDLVKKCFGQDECECWKQDLLVERDLYDPFSCDQWTLQHLLFKGKLDWILLKNISVRSFGVGNINSSDHKPLWIEII